MYKTPTRFPPDGGAKSCLMDTTPFFEVSLSKKKHVPRLSSDMSLCPEPIMCTPLVISQGGIKIIPSVISQGKETWIRTDGGVKSGK